MSTQELTKLLNDNRAIQQAAMLARGICNVAQAKTISTIQSLNRDLNRSSSTNIHAASVKTASTKRI